MARELRGARRWRLTSAGILLLVALTAAALAVAFGSSSLQEVVIPMAGAVLVATVADAAFGRRP
ncbi:MAG: hypothetical protein QOH76_3132 [Thermoleophilaceae bacterium]|nr:hypothetical protein [Thermoleophilaceae bacterium]